MAFRRLETRGEIRGGRFVAGFSGEQFALPDAVTALRNVRNADKKGRLATVSAVDPLNLAGILLPGPRVPAIYSNRLLFRDGVPVAALVSGEVQYYENIDPAKAWELKNLLLRTPAPAGLAALM
jgi:ATP-dependent Lhr-like helicase